MTNISNDIFRGNAGKIETISKQLNLDIPVELIALPSAGKLYPPDHPFHDQEAVEIRSMTAREEDLLSSQALIKAGTVVDELVKACLQDKSVDITSLLVGDRNALLVAIRVVGYGPNHKGKVTCPECSETFDHTFQLNQLPYKPLGAEPVGKYQNLFSYKLPLSGWNVTFKLLTVADERALNEIEDRKKKIGGQVENRVTNRLLYSILSLNGETDRLKIQTIISNLRAGDSRALRSYIDKIEPELNMTQDVKCRHCSVTSEVSVPLGANFFWPDFD